MRNSDIEKLNISDHLALLMMFCLPYFAVATLFFIATMNLPMEFYDFLRIFVTFVLHISTIALIITFTKFWTPIIALNILISVLFNPLIPFSFEKDVWIVLDIVCAFIMISIAIYNAVYWLILSDKESQCTTIQKH